MVVEKTFEGRNEGESTMRHLVLRALLRPAVLLPGI
jgi:hypothetical protein